MTTFADILGQSRQINVSGLQVCYRPHVITTGMMEQLLAAGDEPKLMLRAYRELVPSFIESWDLVNEGQPVPLTPEGIDTVPLIILDMVFEAIMDDREQRRSEEGNDSSASTAAPPPDSTTPSSTESHQNGSDSSQPLASTALAPGSS